MESIDGNTGIIFLSTLANFVLFPYKFHSSSSNFNTCIQLHEKLQKRCQTRMPLYRHKSAKYAPNSGDLELKTPATRRCVENER